MGGRDHFEGKGLFGDKKQYKFFVGNEILNIFHLTIFFFNSKNNQVIFDGALDDKNKYNLFHGKWGTEYSSEIFSSKLPIWPNESQKTCFGDTFSLIGGVLFDRLFPKKIRFTHVCIRTNHDTFMEIG